MLFFYFLFFANFQHESAEARALVHASAIFGKVALDDPQVESKALLKSTPYGIHITYMRTFQNIPVWDRIPRTVHFGRDAERIVKVSFGKPFRQPPAFGQLSARRIAEMISMASGQKQADYKLTRQEPLWIVDEKGIIPAIRLILKGASPTQILQLDLDSRTGRVVNRFHPILFHRNGSARVLRHNPVAAPRDDAGLFADVTLHHLDGSGYLRGDYVDVTAESLSDLDPESASHWALTYQPGAAFEPDLVFSYELDDPRYEEVSAYFWMERAQRFLQARGYQLVDFPIPVNVHWFNETNAAYFTGSKSIVFGDGVIDSAEDGDVVRHEYGHAVLDDIGGSRFYDYHGSMLHEGFSDFFSYLVGLEASEEVGYDRYPDFVGEWIGSTVPADPPHIRTMNPPAYRYPQLTYQQHQDGQLWSSAFYQLGAEIGVESFTEILFEALFLTESADPSHLSQSLLLADEQINQGVHATCLRTVLNDRGLLEPELLVEDWVPGTLIHKSDGWVFKRLQVPENQKRLRITATPPSVGFFRMLMRKEKLPTLGSFEKWYEGINSITWELNASLPGQLEPGATYYLAFQNFDDDALTPVVEVDEGLPTLDRLPLQVPQTTLLSEAQRPLFLLSDIGHFKALVLSYELEDTVDLLFAVSGSPFTLDDAFSGKVWSFSAYEASGIAYIDLERFFPGETELYLSMNSDFYNPDSRATVVVRGLDEDEQEPTLGIPLEVELGEHYENFWTFNLQEQSPGLIFTTSSDHPFTVVPAHSPYEISSTLQNGIETIVLDSSQWPMNLGGKLQVAPDLETLPGAYTIHIEGTPGETTCLLVQESFAQTTTILEPGEPSVQELAVNELAHFQFTLPLDAHDIRLSIPNVTAESDFRLGIYSHGIPRNHAKDPWKPRLNAKTPRFRAKEANVHIPDIFVYEPSFKPGETYEVYVYNPLSVSQPLELLFDYSTQPETVEHLYDGMEITLEPDGFEFLDGIDRFRKQFLINPPLGTRRVQLEFEHLSGSRSVGVNVYGADQKLHPFLMYDIHIDVNELRYEPEQPFPIFFSYAWTVDDLPPPTFRLKITNHQDGPHNAILNEDQPQISGGLASSRPWPTEIQIPENTRQVDIAWKAEQEPLDIRTLILADVGPVVPADVAPLFERLEVGDEYRLFKLKTKRPFQEMATASWVVDQRMSPSFLRHPGYDPTDTSFPFSLSVRYRKQMAQGIFSIPAAISDKAVGSGEIRVFNPGGKLVSTNLSGTPSQSIAPGGFLQVEASPGQHVSIIGDAGLVQFTGLYGELWRTTSGGPVFFEDQVILPHVSPDGSAWTAYLHHANGQSATLNGPYGSFPLVSAHLEPQALENTLSIASWRSMAVVREEDAAFGELSLFVTQYWNNGNQMVSEQPVNGGARTFFVPHLPDNPAWWSGLTLSNVGRGDALINVRLYGLNGAESLTHTFTLPLGETRVDLMDAYLPEGLLTTTGAWLRIDSSEPLAALEFMGGIHTGDTAGFLLPSGTGRSLVLPGNIHEGNQGIAVVNTVAQKGDVLLEAVGGDGQVIAIQHWLLEPFQRKLFVTSDLNIDEPYMLRISSEQLPLVSFQLDIDVRGSLAATAAVVIEE